MLLPITNYKDEIIEAVRDHAFTIICAETGSGKSTQIPQYLANDYHRVVVTEPRIMAAKNLARRVAEEMDVTLGQEVGYRTGYDRCACSDTKILYCTDGLQLIRTIFHTEYEEENVLIIDEVHEWNLNIEVLIAWCKFMHKKWNTKVVIMSATLDTDTLANFFGQDVAVLKIPGNLYNITVIERPAYMFMDTIKENIAEGNNILVFVAGKKEIHDVMEGLKEENATVLPLHGEMEWEEQKKCFESYPNSRVVVATNVAQTSLTIPDLDSIVDRGEARISIAENGIQGLFLKAVSLADLLQRMGRGARTRDSKYFLCSDISIADRPKYTVPEIQRSILDRVVLQVAEIGLDAEKLEFFHQPDLIAIQTAKKELTAIGALVNNQVTELGHKIVKMPVSVQLARMIIEAEKYGVTEPVITIAAIIEMGGLLAKDRSYREFTSEKESDLLAELDIWNYINKLGYIDFEKLGIKKKSFFKIKEHIKKLKEALYGIVEITNNDDREVILKSCLSGLVSHIYVKEDDYYAAYTDGETEGRLDRSSCLTFSNSKFVVGIPKIIEAKNFWGWKESFMIIKFASKIDLNVLLELVPSAITEEKESHYSPSLDTVVVTVKKYFAGVEVDTVIYYDRNHPDYARLKEEYEQEWNYYNQPVSRTIRQEAVLIGKKQFEVHYSPFDNNAEVYLDLATLFTSDVKELFLDNGKRVYFCSDQLYGRRESNLVALRNAVQLVWVNRKKENIKREYERIKITRLQDLFQNADKIGKVELIGTQYVSGIEPIYTYGYLSLKKNTVSLRISDDKELADTNTLEVLQFLFFKEIEKNYGENKFSHQAGKKKKILTEAEKEVKREFDALVREVISTLTLENVQENLDFLEEYYQELMA